MMIAEHRFYRDYIIREEGVFRLELLTMAERYAIDAWPWVFLVLWALSNNLVLFLAFAISVIANFYFPGVIGNFIRAKLYSKPDSDVLSRAQFISWADVGFVDLWPQKKILVFIIKGKPEGGKVKPSDIDNLKAFLAPIVSNRLRIGNTDGKTLQVYANSNTRTDTGR